VAIHGLNGHAFDTWTDKDGHLWLRDSLPARIPKVLRVFTFGYDSVVVFGSSRSSINDFAIDLATRLELERRHAEERQRPLIFVCHSLGGVIFKEFLAHVSLQLDRGRDLLRSISGVVFMGTPHRGSRAATPAGLLSRIINTVTFGSAVRSDLIRTLHVSSVELETISRHATELLKGLSVVSFYEQRPIGPTLVSLFLVSASGVWRDYADWVILSSRLLNHSLRSWGFPMSEPCPSTRITGRLLGCHLEESSVTHPYGHPLGTWFKVRTKSCVIRTPLLPDPADMDTSGFIDPC
jgi:hypothetical protein